MECTILIILSFEHWLLWCMPGLFQNWGSPLYQEQECGGSSDPPVCLIQCWLGGAAQFPQLCANEESLHIGNFLMTRHSGHRIASFTVSMKGWKENDMSCSRPLCTAPDMSSRGKELLLLFYLLFQVFLYDYFLVISEIAVLSQPCTSLFSLMPYIICLFLPRLLFPYIYLVLYICLMHVFQQDIQTSFNDCWNFLRVPRHKIYICVLSLPLQNSSAILLCKFCRLDGLSRHNSCRYSLKF